MNRKNNSKITGPLLTALYCRLSLEDGKDNESMSISNQKLLLKDYAEKNGMFNCEYYVDDGFTGRNFNRPAFRRMISDIEAGKISCVITKDLSRLGRNYIESGSYMEVFFPKHNVRYIAITDNYDSVNKQEMDIAPFKNILNDNYCYQTSKKIRQVFDYKRRNGQYIGSFAPYGYIKDPKDKHQLIVDPEAAETVKRIYEMCLQGTAKLQIVMYLNDHGIPSPTAYRKLKGLPYSPAISDAPMWGNKIITDILRNPIYTGDLVQGRRRVKSYKVHSTRHGNRAGIQALRLCARVWRGQTLRD